MSKPDRMDLKKGQYIVHGFCRIAKHMGDFVKEGSLYYCFTCKVWIDIKEPDKVIPKEPP